MLRFRNLKKGDIDVFITSSTFFSGIFLSLIDKVVDDGHCLDNICITYTIALNLTALFWIFVAAFSILYRLHYEKINRIIIVTTHLLMRIAVCLSIVTININLWHQYDQTIGAKNSLGLALFGNFMTLLMIIIYLIDLYQFRTREDQP